MNIFKTFEIFLREPLSILREKFIQIVNVNSGLTSQTNIGVDMLGQKTQITVINNEKVYKLLKTVQYKQEKLAAKQLQEKDADNQVVIGQLFGRSVKVLGE